MKILTNSYLAHFSYLSLEILEDTFKKNVCSLQRKIYYVGDICLIIIKKIHLTPLEMNTDLILLFLNCICGIKG